MPGVCLWANGADGREGLAVRDCAEFVKVIWEIARSENAPVAREARDEKARDLKRDRGAIGGDRIVKARAGFKPIGECNFVQQ